MRNITLTITITPHFPTITISIILTIMLTIFLTIIFLTHENEQIGLGSLWASGRHWQWIPARSTFEACNHDDDAHWNCVFHDKRQWDISNKFNQILQNWKTCHSLGQQGAPSGALIGKWNHITLIHFDLFQEGLKLDRIQTFPFPQLSLTLMIFHLIFHSTQFLIQTKCHPTPFHPTDINPTPIHPNLTTRTVTPQAPHQWSSCGLNITQSLLPTRYPPPTFKYFQPTNFSFSATCTRASSLCCPSAHPCLCSAHLCTCTFCLCTSTCSCLSTGTPCICWACTPGLPCSCWTCAPWQATLRGDNDDAAFANKHGHLHCLFQHLQVKSVQPLPITVAETYTGFDCRSKPYQGRHYADPEAGCEVSCSLLPCISNQHQGNGQYTSFNVIVIQVMLLK